MHKFLKFLLPVFAVALFFGSVSVTESRAQGVLNTILQRMDQQNKALTSLRAGVTMTKVNTQLDEADKYVGTVLYLPRKGKDAYVRIDWTSPNESLAVRDSKYVLYKPSIKSYYTGSVNDAKGSGKAGGALAFMNMSRAQLKENFEVKYLGEATVASGTETWHLQLTPKVATSYKSAEVWIDKDGFPVQSKVYEKNNDTTTILLSKLEKNVSLKGSAFSITVPKDAKRLES